MAKIVVKIEGNKLVLVEAKDQVEATEIVTRELKVRAISAWFEEFTSYANPHMAKRVARKDYIAIL